jgi:glucosamine 6-phosphate synthetase-like amidotransferase/phosphosugar isomerase protein
MCGIAGFNLADEDAGRLDSRKLAAELLLAIEERGRHATGAAWSKRGEDGPEVWYSKRAVPAARFLPDLSFMSRFSRNVVLHTRYATKGSPSNNDNNHPIVVPGVVGVHNGGIWNDDEIIAAYGGERTGEVDSEAAFRLIANAADPIADLPRLRGRVALAWIDVDRPHTLHLARLTDSPLAIGMTPGGSTVFASTERLLALGCRRAGVTLEMITGVDEMTYISASRGVIHEWRSMADITTNSGRSPR